MAKILLSAAMNRPWSPGHSLAPALERTGHTTHVFDYTAAENIERGLLDAVAAFAPDLHVVHGGEAYTADLIQRLRDDGLHNVLWYPFVMPQPEPEVVALGGAFDVVFTIAKGMVERFRTAGLQRVEWLPEAMEPSIYDYDAITDLDRRLFTCDVTLVGKLESDNPAYMERWKLVKRIVDENFDIKWWGPRIRRKIGTFVLGLLLSKVSRAYGGRFVWNETYAKAIHLSKIFVARDAYPQIELSMSARAFTAMGLGAFYLSFPTRGMATVFEPGKELVLFETPDEMVDRIRHYLGHEEERVAIAAAARKKVLDQHTYTHRFQRMFEILAEHGIALPPPGG